MTGDDPLVRVLAEALFREKYGALDPSERPQEWRVVWLPQAVRLAAALRRHFASPSGRQRAIDEGWLDGEVDAALAVLGLTENQ